MSSTRLALRSHRRRQGLTQEAIAFALGVSTATYRSWERGTTAPHQHLRAVLARELEVSVAELDRIIEDLDPVEVPGGPIVPAWIGHYVTLEARAARIEQFEAALVPVLLQTEAYARALYRTGPGVITETDIDVRVNAGIERQRALHGLRPAALSVVIDESALLRGFGDGAVMAEQFDHLVEMSARPLVELRVLPLTAGVFFTHGSFTMLTPHGAARPELVCVEGRSGMYYFDRDDQADALAVHARAFGHLASRALPPDESVDWIRAAAAQCS